MDIVVLETMFILYQEQPGRHEAMNLYKVLSILPGVARKICTVVYFEFILPGTARKDNIYSLYLFYREQWPLVLGSQLPVTSRIVVYIYNV